MVFGADAKVADIQAAVECRTGIPVADQRLIFGGRELDGSKTLEELNVHPKEVLHLLPRLPHVCREWAATGSCSRGRRCYQKCTHTVEFSPRYVEHHAKHKDTSESSSPSTTPPATPEVGPAKFPSPPTAPRPPSASAYGAIGSSCRRRPQYGMLGGEKLTRANWKGGCPATISGNKGAQSNSGDWDGLVSAITSVVESEPPQQMEVEEDLVDEHWDETSWEEAALSAAAMGFSCDSSYDSQSSMCNSERQEISNMMLCDKGPSQGRSVCENAAPLPAKEAGLEFAAGVHLIEEMENQVKQWEESESSREVAYKAWVSQQMMRAMHTGEPPVRAQ